MTVSEIITIIAGAVAGSAVLFGAVGWFLKSIMNHILARDIEKFKLNLQNESQQELLRLQSVLEFHEFEHQVRFGQLHERRASIIADIYGRLYEFYWAVCAFLKHYHTSDNTKKAGLLKKLEEEAEGFKDFFDKHRIYFTDETCSLIDKLVDSLNEAYIPLGMYVERFERNDRQEIREEWAKGARIMQKDFPSIKASLESSFRQILGVNQVEKEG